MGNPKINHQEYYQLLDLVMQTNHPLLVVGKPGVGKTRTPMKYCKDNGIDLLLSHPATDAPQDIKGYPSKGKVKLSAIRGGDDLESMLEMMDAEDADVEVDAAVFLLFDTMLKAVHATKPTIWFFDDFGQAAASVQSALMQLFGDRKLGGIALPDCVKIIAATNGKEHRADVKGLLEPMKSRFGMIVELVEDPIGFRQFAQDNGIHSNIQLFLEYQPQAFCVWEPKGDMENQPNPRLWEKLSDQLIAWESKHPTKDKANQNIRAIIAEGCIGEKWGKQFVAFERLQDRIPDYYDIIQDPENFPINQALDVRFAMLGMLANKGKLEHADEIFQYVKKMAKEYQIVFFRLVRQYNKELRNSDAGQRWWAGNLDVYID